MAYIDFEKQWLGQRVDHDHANLYQCVDLAKQYADQELHITPGAWGAAKNWWLDESIAAKLNCNRIATTHVQAGDIVPLMPVDTRFAHRDGHIGIATGNQTPNTFELLEQNGTGSGSGTGADAIRKRYINKTRMYGVLRPKTVASPAPLGNNQGEMIANADQAHKIYRMLRPNGHPSQDEINGTAGKRTFAGFLNDAQAEIANRDANLRSQAEQLTAMQATINDLQQKVTDVSVSKKLTMDQLRDAMQKVAELTNTLENTRANVVVLQDKLPQGAAPPAPPPEKPVWVIRLIDWLARKK